MAEKANPIDVEQFLKNRNFPATKSDLVQFVKDQHAPNPIIAAVENLPNRKYSTATDAARETFLDEEELPRGLDSCDD
jgi:hypothetical protein